MLPPLESGWACDHFYDVYHRSGVPRTALDLALQIPKETTQNQANQGSGSPRRWLRCLLMLDHKRPRSHHSVYWNAHIRSLPCGYQAGPALWWYFSWQLQLSSALQASPQGARSASEDVFRAGGQLRTTTGPDTAWVRRIRQQGLISLLTLRLMKYIKLVVILSH